MTPKEQWKLAWGLARVLAGSDFHFGDFPAHRVSKQMMLAIHYAQGQKFDELSRRKPLRILRMLAQRRHAAGYREPGYFARYNCRCVATWVMPA